MARNSDSDNEDNLFKQATGDVRPIKQDRIRPTPKRPRPIPKKTLEDEQQVLDSLLSDDWDPGDIESGEELLFSRPGIQKSVFRKLRTGKYAVEAELDLHGVFVREARGLVGTFIRDSQSRGLRCVRIIHGKGLSSPNKMPVLKNKVNQWLQLIDAVLAFSSALPVDGGTGAVYVLLKKSG
ncbi:MAG: Smr/MutS family protein [Acidiferrobacterales bacterium]